MTSEVLMSLPLHAKYQGELTARQAGVDFTEPEDMQYLDTPLWIYRSTHPQGDRFDVAYNHTGLDGEQLFAFLTAVAPDKTSGALRAVIADWGVVEEAQRNDNPEPTTRAQGLVALHERLGEPWAEFMKSRPAFLRTMQDSVIPTFNDPFYLQLSAPEEVRKGLLDDVARRGLPASIDELTEFFGHSGLKPEASQSLVIEALGAAVNARRRQKNVPPITSQAELQRRYCRWIEDKRHRFVYELMQRLPAVQRQRLNAHLQAEFYDSHTLPSGEVVCYPRWRLQQSLAEAFRTEQTVQRDDFEAQVVTLENCVGKQDTMMIPGSAERVTPPLRLQPLLSWIRSAVGQRDFVFERTTSIDRRTAADGVMGALAVAYFSPSIREAWPTHMYINRRRQFLGPAQVPVFALLPKNKKQLLNSDFVMAVEAVA